MNDGRKRLSKAAEDRERDGKRQQYGASVTAKLQGILSRDVKFDANMWPSRKNIGYDSAERSEVAARVGGEFVDKFLAEIESIVIGRIVIYFDEYEYMGSLDICASELALVSRIAQVLNDSCIIEFVEMSAGIIVDYYDDQYLMDFEKFSLIAIGSENWRNSAIYAANICKN